MIFGGFQKLTLLDFPGKVSCTLFTKGCNLRCPFCHNAPLVTRLDSSAYTEEEILAFLKKRQGILEGVCITGGEPLLNDLAPFLEKVKALGYAVKLDTNGFFPERLKSLCEKGLIDYIAMDIKNSFEKYPETTGIDSCDIAMVKESIRFIMESGIDYEFRTTVTNELHTPGDIESIASYIEGAEKYFIQNFLDSGNLIGEGLTPQSDENLDKMAHLASKYTKYVKTR